MISLSEHFTFGKLIRFTLPSIAMMICASVYGVVDGFFVSNFVGTNPFAALNLVIPILMILGSIGFMIGTGGSALVAKLLGRGRQETANSVFSFLVYALIGFGLVLAGVGNFFLGDIVKALGASGEMLGDCLAYGHIVLAGLPFLMMQNAFQSFLVTAEHPKAGFAITVSAGFVNVALDAVFIVLFDWGLKGAALATVIGECVGGLAPLCIFLFNRKWNLKLGKCRLNGVALFRTLTNGSSEFMTNISLSIVAIFYNWQLMRFIGDKGVAIYGVIMYVGTIFLSSLIGFAIGSAPLVSYHLGAGNRNELHNLFKKSLAVVGTLDLILTAAAILFAAPLSGIFLRHDPALLAETSKALSLYAISFLFVGFNIFASAFFTALNNGPVSAALAFVRTLVFELLFVLLIPELFGAESIWFSITFAEIFALAVSAFALYKYRNRYGYAGSGIKTRKLTT